MFVNEIEHQVIYAVPERFVNVTKLIELERVPIIRLSEGKCKNLSDKIFTSCDIITACYEVFLTDKFNNAAYMYDIIRGYGIPREKICGKVEIDVVPYKDDECEVYFGNLRFVAPAGLRHFHIAPLYVDKNSILPEGQTRFDANHITVVCVVADADEDVCDNEVTKVIEITDNGVFVNEVPEGTLRPSLRVETASQADEASNGEISLDGNDPDPLTTVNDIIESLMPLEELLKVKLKKAISVKRVGNSIVCTIEDDDASNHTFKLEKPEEKKLNQKTTKILMSQGNPTGHKLEELLLGLIEDLAIKNAFLDECIKNGNNAELSEKIQNANNNIIYYLSQAHTEQVQTMARLGQLGEDKGPTGNRLLDENKGTLVEKRCNDVQ